MAERQTFSALVDRVVADSHRINLRDTIIGYVNVTVRECQVMAYFERDFVEDQIVGTNDPHIFTRPDALRLMRTAYYPGWDVYPRYIMPGLAQQGEQFFYYGGPTYYVFKGHEAGQNIDIGYYMYQNRLVYFEDLTSDLGRPAKYDADTAAWTYWDTGTQQFVSTLGTTALNEAAEAKVTNWLLFHWYDVIVEGTLAKIFKLIDDPRAKQAFALYKSFQKDILRGEAHASLDV